MAIKESQLTAITDVTDDDYVRIVTSTGGSRNTKVSELAEGLIDDAVLVTFIADGWTAPEN